MIESLKDRLPDRWRRKLRRLYYLPVDTLDAVLGRRDPLLPPRGLYPGYVLSGGFKKHGEDFAQLLVEYGGLRPDSVLLEVGCGIGRIAVPVVKRLNERGWYEGLDIVPEVIEWCQKSISTRYPNARFRLANIYNGNYHPEGEMSASTYRFPYEDDTFDLIFLKSVFTHMVAEDTVNYVEEVARTLKPGGRCLITYFLLNDDARRRMASGAARRVFPHQRGEYAVQDAADPEAAVAYEEEFIRALYDRNGLRVVDAIHYGSWRGREEALFAQDIIVAQK